jgi:hypothetical protein
MSGQIFISYRRDYTSASAGRLYDRLSSHFPSNRIFIDVDNIAPGVDFVEAIENSVGSCDLLISVIGKNWLTSSDDEGNRRLDNPEDFLRLEIGTALRRNIRVIPVRGINELAPSAGRYTARVSCFTRTALSDLPNKTRGDRRSHASPCRVAAISIRQ